MSVEEGLKSTEVEVIKEARGVAKGKVTKNIKSLKNSLVSDINGKFLFEEINEKIVKDIYENLDTCHDIFTVLHEKFCFHRVADKDPSEEGKSKEKEDLYSDTVSKEVS